MLRKSFHSVVGPGRLVCAFDATYLTQTSCQMRLFETQGLVGGAWSPGPAEDQCFVSLEEGDVDIKRLPKASSMLTFTAWDPCAKKRTALSMASMPVEHSFQGPQGTYRGNWVMAEIVGRFMEKSDGLVKALIFDGATTHAHVRKLLHGQFENIEMTEVKHLPFFKDLQYMPVPDNNLPRFPIQVARYKGEVIWALPGVCLLLLLFSACFESCKLHFFGPINHHKHS